MHVEVGGDEVRMFGRLEAVRKYCGEKKRAREDKRRQKQRESTTEKEEIGEGKRFCGKRKTATAFPKGNTAATTMVENRERGPTLARKLQRDQRVVWSQKGGRLFFEGRLMVEREERF